MLVSYSRNMNNLIDKLRLPFRNDRELFSSLYRILGFYPKNIDYYKTALMHRSLATRNEKGRLINNERLEFLGDAILDAVVGDIVFRHFPNKREGFLTNARSKVVKRSSLGKLAKEIGLDSLIRSSNKHISHNSYMEGNAFEALIGAVYLDRGYSYCMEFMKKRICSNMLNIDKVAYKEENFKSHLLEWAQKHHVELDFVLINEGREDKCNLFFEYQVEIAGMKAGKGRGYSKKEGQQNASKETLNMLRHDRSFTDKILETKKKDECNADC